METAKRILTKEKIDRQLSGQSGASATFMKVSESHKPSNKKAVSLNTQERADNKIDRLTSLVNEMKVKIDKHDAQFKPQIYQRKRRGQNRCNYNHNDFQTEIDHLMGIEGQLLEVEEDLVGIIDKIIEGDSKTILGMTTEETIIEIKCIGIEVEVETIKETLIDTGLGITTYEAVISVQTGVG